MVVLVWWWFWTGFGAQFDACASVWMVLVVLVVLVVVAVGPGVRAGEDIKKSQAKICKDNSVTVKLKTIVFAAWLAQTGGGTILLAFAKVY